MRRIIQLTRHYFAPLRKSLFAVVFLGAAMARSLCGAELSGLVNVGGDRLASIAARDEAARWVTVGQRVGNARVKQIDLEHGLVELESEDGTIERLVLRAAHVQAAAPESAWFLSEKNPMFWRATALPPGVVARWRELSQTERDELVAFYARHGWRLTFDPVRETLTLESVPELKREQRAARERLLSEFSQTLSPELRQDFNTLRKQPLPVARIDSAGGAEARAAGDILAKYQKVIDQFTPTQKAAYEAIKKRIDPRLK